MRQPLSRWLGPGRNLLLGGTVLLLALLAGSGWIVLDRRSVDLGAAEHETDSLAVALAAQTSLTFGAVDFVLRDLLDRIRLAGFVTPETLAAGMATPEVQQMLRDEIAGLGQIAIASIIGADGRLINFSRTWPIPEIMLADRDFFQAARDDPTQGAFIGPPAASFRTGQATIYMARRIAAPDGRFLGVVSTGIRLEYFANLYRAVSEGAGRSVGLRRRDGTMLARYPETGHQLGVVPSDDATVQVIQQGARAVRTLSPSPIDGRMRMRAARVVPDFPLVVVVTRTQDSILADWEQESLAIGAGAGFAAIGLIIGFALLLRQVVGRARSEATLAVTLNHMSQGIMMVDNDNRVQVYNHRVLDMLGFPDGLLASRPLFEDVLRFQWAQGEFGPQGGSLDDALRQFILAGGLSNEPQSYERRRPDGTILEIGSIPMEGGGVVRTYTDVTAARTREASLQAALTARAAAEQALNQHNELMEQHIQERTRPLAASEARHRDMADVSCDWIWEIDPALQFTFVSKRFGDTSGLGWTQVNGRRLTDLVELGFDALGMEALCATIDTGASFHDSIHRVDVAEGNAHFWILSGKPFNDARTGVFAGYRGTGTDVTERIERETALNAALTRAEAAERVARHATTRLTEAIEAIPEGFVLHDADDRLVLCNELYAEFYELSSADREAGALFADALRATTFRGDLATDGHDPEAKLAERLARHRAAEGNREEQHLANGRWLQVYEQRTSDGGTVGIRVDVTEARKREAAERDREKLAALGHLAGGVAHELNNLLQPVLALPEMVRDRLPEDDIESREDLDCVIDSAGRMREIVRNILLFARKEEPLLAPLDLVAELRAALSFVGDLMPASVTVQKQGLEAWEGCKVAANRTQLTQVLTNLLVNAAQATTGSGTVTVSVGRTDPAPEEAEALAIEAGRRYLTVSIADTGSGMDEATQARIFEPFFTTKPVGQGTGLGLSVVYGILRGWQGAITVRSTLGEGTTFVLYVPVLPTG